jgi:hypothetical protein
MEPSDHPFYRPPLRPLLVFSSHLHSLTSTVRSPRSTKSAPVSGLPVPPIVRLISSLCPSLCLFNVFPSGPCPTYIFSPSDIHPSPEGLARLSLLRLPRIFRSYLLSSLLRLSVFVFFVALFRLLQLSIDLISDFFSFEISQSYSDCSCVCV